MGAFDIVRKSIYSPAFYQSLLVKPLSFSLKYYASFSIGLAVALTVFLSAFWVPAAHEFMTNAGEEVLKNFPENLVIRIEGGEVTEVSEPEPYVIPLPESASLPEGLEGEPVPKNLIVVDTTNEFTIDRFRSFDTLMMLTRDSVVYREAEGRVAIQSLSGMPATVVDKEFVGNLADAMRSASRFIAPIIVFATFFVFIAGFAFVLGYLVPGAVLALGIARLNGWKIKYGKAYQFGIHAATASILLYFMLLLLLPALQIPFLFTGVFALVLWFNLPRAGYVSPAMISAAAEPDENEDAV